MLVTLFPYLKIVGGNRYTSSIILMSFLMILYRAWDSISDLFQGALSATRTYGYCWKNNVLSLFNECGRLISLSFIIKISLRLFSCFGSWNGCFFILIYELPFFYQFETFKWKDIFDTNYFPEVLSILKNCFPLF